MPKLLKQLLDSGVNIEYHDITDLDPSGPPVIEVRGSLAGINYAERHTLGSVDGSTPDPSTMQADIDARRASVVKTLAARKAVMDNMGNLK